MYLRPRTLQEACDALAEGGLTVLSGGTDVFPALGQRPPGPLLDISRLGELDGITIGEDVVRIGGRTRWSAIAAARLPPGFEALRLAAREVGSIQVQNAGTLAGNLCNASPAADGVPPLLILDAEVELASRRGLRTLPLAEFVLGNRLTDRRPDEILTAVTVPRAAAEMPSTFVKLGARRYLVISIAMVAAALAVDRGRVAAARIAIGACSPVARRMPALETALVGLRKGEDVATRIEARHLAPLDPIDDGRSSAAYRLDAVRTLLARAVGALLGGA